MLRTITEMAAHYQVTTAAVYYQIRKGGLPDPRVRPVSEEAAVWPTRLRGKSVLRIVPSPSAASVHTSRDILIQKVCELEEKVNILIDHVSRSNLIASWRSAK